MVKPKVKPISAKPESASASANIGSALAESAKILSKIKTKIFAKEHKPLLAPTQILPYKERIDLAKKEIAKLIVGQEYTVDCLLRAILCNGHVYVIALPGLAKTILIRTLAVVSGCAFNRIQFTVDLLPTDITGLTTFDRERNVFTVVKGPIFTNFVIADEINRTPPKTQSALLEAMQENQVTIGRETFKIKLPFFVMATQNPIESAGTYPLPEAQIDRFLFQVGMNYPKENEEQSILHHNISLAKFEEYKIRPILNADMIIKMQEIVKQIHVSDSVEKYIVRITNATRYPDQAGIKLGNYIEYGASPRASIGLFIAAKSKAFMDGMSYVTPQHVKDVAFDVLRHRILLTYEAQAENLVSDEIIAEILARVPVP